MRLRTARLELWQLLSLRQIWSTIQFGIQYPSIPLSSADVTMRRESEMSIELVVSDFQNRVSTILADTRWLLSTCRYMFRYRFLLINS